MLVDDLEKLDPAKRTLLYVGAGAILVFFFGMLNYLLGPPSETPSANVLAIAEFAKEKTEVKVPIFQPLPLSNLSRSEIFKIRSNFVNQTPNLLADSYSPSGIVFANMESGLPWFSNYGFFVKGQSPESMDGPSAEARYIDNPFLLVSPEFWGLSQWMPEGVKWNIDNISTAQFQSEDFPYYCRANSLSWWPAESKAESTYYVSDFVRRLNLYSKTPLSDAQFYFGLTAYNARDFGFNYLAVDPKLSQNIQSLGGATTPLQITDRIVNMEGFCVNEAKSCNHSDIPMLDASKIVAGPLPAKLAVKLWYTEPASADAPANMYFYINFL